MGFPIEMNWVLKLKEDQGLDEENLEEGQTYEFKKEGNRIYPLGAPIDLVNHEWHAIAKVIVIEFTNKMDETTGLYKVKSIFDDDDRDTITQYWGKR